MNAIVSQSSSYFLGEFLHRRILARVNEKGTERISRRSRSIFVVPLRFFIVRYECASLVTIFSAIADLENLLTHKDDTAASPGLKNIPYWITNVFLTILVGFSSTKFHQFLQWPNSEYLNVKNGSWSIDLSKIKFIEKIKSNLYWLLILGFWIRKQVELISLHELI